MKKYYIDKRVLVNGNRSHLELSNFLDLSEYVAYLVTGNTSSTLPLVFRNGLTKDAFGNVELGGTLLDTTTINGDDNVLEISDASIQFTGSDAHNFNSTITTATTTTVIQNTLFGSQITKTDTNGSTASVEVYDFLGATNIKLNLTNTSSDTITFTLVPDAGHGLPSIYVDGLVSYDSNDNAVAAGMNAGMIYVTTATNALTIVGGAPAGPS